MDVNVKCPHCKVKEEFEIDSEFQEDYWTYETKCSNCWKNYWVRTWIVWQYHNKGIKLDFLK